MLATLAQSETPGLLFLRIVLTRDDTFHNQLNPSSHLLCLSEKEGKYSFDVATGVCLFALEPNSIWQMMNGLKFVSHTNDNFSVLLELWLTFTTFRWKILR